MLMSGAVLAACCCAQCPGAFTLALAGVAVCPACITTGSLLPGRSVEMVSVGVNTTFMLGGPVSPTIVSGEERCVYQPLHYRVYPSVWLSYNVHENLTCTWPTPTPYNSLILRTIVHIRKSDGKIRLVKLWCEDLAFHPVFDSGTVAANSGDAIANTITCGPYQTNTVFGGTATVTIGA
jgi:hypothetical protein